jgi:hypothetical protein
MARRIQLRRDTAANWTNTDPVLAQGEVGVDLSSMQIKVGNGVATWTELSYLASDSIVDLTGYATEDYVDQAIATIPPGGTDLTGYATEDYVDQAILTIDKFLTADELLAYDFLSSTDIIDAIESRIPSDFITSNDLSNYALLEQVSDISLLSDNEGRIPSRLSELENDEGFITLNDIPSTGNGTIDLVEGNTYFVTTLGNDANTGSSVDKPLKSVKAAIAKATAGDIIKIAAGTYIEEFPLTVPKGVTVRGASLRATTIRPTELTKDKDCFLLDGETTVEEMSIKGMFYNSVDNTGYAFRFKANAEVATRSPYIQRVTVLNRGSTTTTADPYGFLSADCGRGVLLDGADVTRNSIEAAILFNECTFIVPNSRALIMTNGARSEWLNCFTYFADLAIEGVSGETGRGGEGKTYLTISEIDGTFLVGDTITVQDDFNDVVETATISARVGDTLTLDGKKPAFALFKASRPSKTDSIIKHGTSVIETSIVKFGNGSLSTESGGFLSILNEQDLNFEDKDFTVEFWVNRNFTFGTQVYFDTRTTNNFSLPHLYSEGSNLIYYINNTTIINVFGALSQTNQWYHIAVSRKDNFTRLFVDGTLVSIISDITNYSSSSFFIAASLDGSSLVSGYIDEFRITKGISRYEENFTVSTQEFINDANTVLLLHFNGTIEDDSGLPLTITSTSGGTAASIDRVNLLEFGAELRSIAGANVYGNQGIKANGVGVKLHLISHNFAYIGTGADLTNDSSKVVQLNEVIEVNNGEVFYSSIDQDGNYRIGDLFTVNYETGNVTFSSSDFNIAGLTQITLDDGTNVSKLSSTGVETGNLILAGNTVSTKTGNLVLDPGGSGEILLNANVIITGDLSVSGQVGISNGNSSVSIPDENGAVVIAVSANDSSMTQHEWQFETGGDLPSIRGPSGAAGFRIYSEELVQIGAQSETDNSVFVAQLDTAYISVSNTVGTTFLNVSADGVLVTAIGNSTPNLSVEGNVSCNRVIAKLAPATSKGVNGDRQGMIAVDAEYIYVCTADYTDGVADIWSRNPLASGAW